MSVTPADIKVRRLSGLIQFPDQDQLFDIDGWMNYRRMFETDVTVTFQYEGHGDFDQEFTITLPAQPGLAIYNGTGDNACYYGSSGDDACYYFGFRSEPIMRQHFGPIAGQSSAFQVEIEVEGQIDFEIHEVGLKVRTAKT